VTVTSMTDTGTAGHTLTIVDVAPTITVDAAVGADSSEYGGPATGASPAWPSGMSGEGAGTLFMADLNSHRRRTMDGAAHTVTVRNTNPSSTDVVPTPREGFAFSGTRPVPDPGTVATPIAVGVLDDEGTSAPPTHSGTGTVR
jgi:hypothetical protein